MKHDMPKPARIPALICLFFGAAVYIALAAYGFARFGFRPMFVTTFLLCLPGYACAFAKMFGWKRRRKLAVAEITLNLSGVDPSRL